MKIDVAETTPALEDFFANFLLTPSSDTFFYSIDKPQRKFITTKKGQITDARNRRKAVTINLCSPITSSVGHFSSVTTSIDD